jgi:hypothetical protein
MAPVEIKASIKRVMKKVIELMFFQKKQLELDIQEDFNQDDLKFLFCLPLKKITNQNK